MTDDTVDVDFITQVADVSEIEFRQLLRGGYGITGTAITVLTGYDDLNFLLEQCQFDTKNVSPSDKFVAKLTNPVEMRVPSIVAAQCELIDIITKAKIPCARLVRRLDGNNWAFVDLANSKRSALRLFAFLPGRTLERFWRDGPGANVDPSNVFRLIGQLLARFHNAADASGALSAEAHNAFRRYYPLISARGWSFLRVEAERHAELNGNRAELCTRIFRQFQTEVLDKVDEFEQGIIHSDFNESNLLLDLDSSGEPVVTGLLDFGDTHHSIRIIDLANTIIYVFLDRFALTPESPDDPATFCAALRDTATQILCAYDTIRQFTPREKERSALAICVKARLVASLIYGLHVLRLRHRKSSNWAYISKTQIHGWQLFERLCDVDLDTVFREAVANAIAQIKL